jgi:hypothetical protein
MPIPATDIDVSKVTTFLKGAGLNQLRCRRRADTLVIESGPAGDTTPHVRLRKLGVNIWATDTATHTGRWEHMPLRGPIADNLKTILENFPWMLGADA